MMNISVFLEHPYIRSIRHPTLPYTLFNYTAACQFDRAWDEYTLMARGLILDDAGSVVARPFKKFFNLDETPETRAENMPNVPFYVSEKIDGSLGILYKHNGELFVSTRGSFVSEQAMWATKWINQRYSPKDFSDNYTYLFEIVYPENRIVVNYGDMETLFLLGMVHKESGKELTPSVVSTIAYEELNDIAVPRFEIKDSLSSVVGEVEGFGGDREGVVISYFRNENVLRVKIKGQKYKSLHKLISGFNEHRVWEILSLGGSLDIFPDEIYAEAKTYESGLRERVRQNIVKVDLALQEIGGLSRKEQAAIVLSRYNDVRQLIFLTLDGRDIERAAWKMVEPA